VAVSPGSTVADGQATAHVTVLLRDAFGNPVPNTTVELTASAANTTFVPPSGATDASGMLQATVSSTEVGVQQINASVGALCVRTTQTFVPGALSLASSTLTVSPSMLTADGTTAATLSLRLVDALQHPISATAVTWQGPAGTAVQPATGQSDSQGYVVAQVNGSVAQAATITARFAGGSLAVPVTLVAGPPAAASSQLRQDPNTPTVADGQQVASLTVYAADAQGNPVAGQLVTFASGGTGDTLMPMTATTDAAGRARTQMTSTVAQSKLVRATLGAGGASASVATTVSFIAGPPDATASSITASPASLTADGVGVSTLRVLARDRLGNVLPGQALTLASSSPFGVLSLSGGNADSAGTFTATLSSTRAQTQTITATFAAPQSPNVATQVVLRPGAPSTQTSVFTASPNSITADGLQQAQLMLQLVDPLGNPVPNVAVTFSSTGSSTTLTPSTGTTDASGTVRATAQSTFAEPKTLTAAFGAASLVANVNFVPGPASAAASSLVLSPNTAVADGNTQMGVVVLAQDAYNNPIGNLPVVLSGLGGSIVASPTQGTTQANGRWTSRLTTTVAQAPVLSAALGTPVQATLSTPAQFVAGAPVPQQSQWVAAPANFVADGNASTTLTATLRDAFANPVANQNVSVVVTGSNTLLAPATGRTLSSGTFATALRTPRAQALTATATINGQWTLSTTATAVPGPAASLQLVGLAGGTAAVTSSPQVTVFDAQNNVATNYAGAVAFASTDTSASLPSSYTFMPADLGSRTFLQGATLVTPGTHTVTATLATSPAVSGSQSGLVIGPPVMTTLVLPAATQPAVCLNVQGGNAASGTALTAETCNNNVAQVFAYGTDGTLRGLNNCVEVAGGVYAANQPIQMGSCTAAMRQRWTLSASGAWTTLGDPNYCLDLVALQAGTAARLQPCAGTPTQLFAPSAASPAYQLVNGNLGQALEVAGSSYTAGTKLQNNTFANASNQAFTWGADRSLRIGGLCVTPANGTLAANTPLQLAACNLSSAQQFQPNGASLTAVGNSALCVDMGTATSSTAAALNVCNGSSGQQIGMHVNAQYYQYRSQSAIATPLCVANATSSTASSNPVTVVPCSGGLGQSWSLNPGVGQTIVFGPNCIDMAPNLLNVLGLSSYNGMPVYTNTCNAMSAAQNWRSKPISGDVYQILWQASAGYCWNGSPNSGTGLKLGSCNATNTNQGFYQLAKSFVLQASVATTACIDVAGGLPVAGAALQYNTCAVSTSQSFTWAPDGSLQYSGLCVDLPAGLVAGSALQLSNCSGAATQKWQGKLQGTTLVGGALQSSSNTNLCVDTSVTSASTPLRLTACTGLAAQSFTVR
jgi:hypothetical protein